MDRSDYKPWSTQIRYFFQKYSWLDSFSRPYFSHQPISERSVRVGRVLTWLAGSWAGYTWRQQCAWAIFIPLSLSARKVIPESSRNVASRELEPLLFCFWNQFHLLVCAQSAQGLTLVAIGRPESPLHQLWDSLPFLLNLSVSTGWPLLDVCFVAQASPRQCWSGICFSR